MSDDRERPGSWTDPTEDVSEQPALDGLELAEVETTPARLEEGAGDRMSEAGADALSREPAATPAGEPASAEAATNSPRRRRGGKPRLNEEQDRRIVEAFEQAKREGRSLKDVAAALSAEMGQPPDYINQRYYYLQRKSRADEGQRPAAARRGRERAGAPAGRGAAAEGRGRRRAPTTTGQPAASPPAAPTGAPAATSGDLVGIARALDELTQLTRSQLGAVAERLQSLETRIAALESRPPADVSVDQVLERLGQVLQERGRAVRGRERVRAAVQEFLKAIDESL